MGLAGIARPARILGVGQDRAPAGRIAGAFREVAGGFVAIDDQPHLVAGLDR